jgi:hypothetical protein
MVTLPEDQYKAVDNTYNLINRGGSNPYPRIVAMPDIVTTQRGDQIIKTLRVRIGHGEYGIAAIEERRAILPPLQTIEAVRTRYNLQSFAIRCAYIGEEEPGGKKWLEFQQRSEENSTFHRI